MYLHVYSSLSYNIVPRLPLLVKMRIIKKTGILAKFQVLLNIIAPFQWAFTSSDLGRFEIDLELKRVNCRQSEMSQGR